jgi:hypothetical protein
MGDNKDKVAKLQKCHKPRLIEAIVSCMARRQRLRRVPRPYPAGDKRVSSSQRDFHHAGRSRAGGLERPALVEDDGANCAPFPPSLLCLAFHVSMAEELKARIRAAKMMSQGVSYSQVVQALAPVYVAPAPTMAPAPVPPRIVRTALTPDEAITILLETVKRLQQR